MKFRMFTAVLIVFAATLAGAQSVRVSTFVRVEPKTFTEVLSSVDTVDSGDYDGAGMWQSSTVAHSATLSWTASPDATLYWPYRATAACPVSGAPAGAARVGTAPVSATTYTDLSVVAGTTYCYYITAASTTGAESAASNAVQAAIPLAPATVLTVTVK